MRRRIHGVVIFCAALLISLACGSLSPPDDCGERIGGTADEALFAENFLSMGLVEAETGEQGDEGGENGPLYNAQDSVKLAFESNANSSMRICVQERRGGGKVVLNKNVDYFAGEGGLVLGAFPKGNYVVRVIMQDTLVKNLPFTID